MSIGGRIFFDEATKWYGMRQVIVFSSKPVLAMDASLPEAAQIAVLKGRILAVGDASGRDQWGQARHNSQLSDSILMWA